MKHIVKSIFVVGWYGYENTGDEAILTVLLPTLRKIFPEAEINVLSGNPSKTAKTYGVKTVGKKRKDIWKIIKTVSVSDLIVMGGGGLIEDYGNKNIVQQYRGIHRIACWLRETSCILRPRRWAHSYQNWKTSYTACSRLCGPYNT